MLTQLVYLRRTASAVRSGVLARLLLGDQLDLRLAEDALLGHLLDLVQEDPALLADVCAVLRVAGLEVVDEPERIDLDDRRATLPDRLPHLADRDVDRHPVLVVLGLVVALDLHLFALVPHDLEHGQVAQLGVSSARLHEVTPAGHLHLAVDELAHRLRGAPVQLASDAFDLEHRIELGDGFLDARHLAVARLLGLGHVDIVLVLRPVDLGVVGRPVGRPPLHGSDHGVAEPLDARVHERHARGIQVLAVPRVVAVGHLHLAPLAALGRGHAADLGLDLGFRHRARVVLHQNVTGEPSSLSPSFGMPWVPHNWRVPDAIVPTRSAPSTPPIMPAPSGDPL